MTDNEDDKHWMQKRRAKPRRAQYLVRVSDHTAMEHGMYVIYSYINTLLNKLSDLVFRSFIRAKFGGGRDQAVLKEFFDLVKSMGLTPREHTGVVGSGHAETAGQDSRGAAEVYSRFREEDASEKGRRSSNTGPVAIGGNESFNRRGGVHCGTRKCGAEI